MKKGKQLKNLFALLTLMCLLSPLVLATDEQSSLSSSSSSSTVASLLSSSSSSSSEASTSSSSSRIASTSSSQVSSSSSSSSSMPELQVDINSNMDIIISLLPKIGDLLTGVGDDLIWPIVQILIILGVAGVILTLFAVVTGVVASVVLAVHKFANKMGRK